MQEVVRVLHVFHGMDCGGAENMIMTLYRHMDRSKIQFDFLVHTTKKCFFDDEILSLGGKIYRVPYYNVKNHFSYTEALKSFFKSHREVKIVHGHLGSCAHLYLKAAKRAGCFTIAHSHNTWATQWNLKNTMYKLFSLETRRVADYFFACGKQAGLDRYGKAICDSNRFKVLNNAIDVEKYKFDMKVRESVRKTLGIDNAFAIGHIGRFCYQKNHAFLLDVFAEVAKNRTDTKLLLVGDGELRGELTEKMERLGITDKVIMLGVRKDVPTLLMGMDCFVFPSHFEGLGIVVVEAQASGIPVVCSDAIQDDAIVTDLVQRLPLSKSPKEWAELVIGCKDIKRLDKTNEIREHGYDILDTSKELQMFYLRNAPQDVVGR